MITFNEWLLLKETRLRGEWNYDANWSAVEDYIKQHVCRDRQNYEKTGRGPNCDHERCNLGSRLHDLALQAFLNEKNLNKQEIDEIIKFIFSSTCNNNRKYGRCNHTGCGKARNLYNWLEIQQRKAA
jgi:hypothetical protein